MNGNHLEQLIAEWYEFQGYFVRRNILVGKRPKGGWECELDIVAFHPEERKLVHLEPSLDANSWEIRERRYKRKFDAGRKHIPNLFRGMNLPNTIDQIAVLLLASKKTHQTLAGGRIMLVQDVLKEIIAGLANRDVYRNTIPEQFPLLRTIHFVAQFWKQIWHNEIDSKPVK